jgi:hypothetical protein
VEVEPIFDSQLWEIELSQSAPGVYVFEALYNGDPSLGRFKEVNEVQMERGERHEQPRNPANGSKTCSCRMKLSILREDNTLIAK